MKEEFEDTKGVIKNSKSKKERQRNGQKKKDKQRWLSESVNQGRTDNTMAKRKGTKGRTTNYKTYT